MRISSGFAHGVLADGRSCIAQSPIRRRKMYIPKPIDTEDVVLPAELLELTEKIAENVHENWAIGRVKEGWVYGEERNDARKTTPCLVPYDQLPESEKAFDRNTALQTLKLIVALGYRIEKGQKPQEV